MDPTASAHNISRKSRKKCDGTLAMITQAFGEEIMRNEWVFEWRNPNSLKPKNDEIGE
jgi:hypothetical protein